MKAKRSIKFLIVFWTSCWYLGSVGRNTFLKLSLSHANPCLANLSQSGITVLICLLMGTFKFKRTSVLFTEQSIILGCFHSLSYFFQTLALSKAAVSFVHTVKALEPLSNAFLTSFMMHQHPSSSQVLALLVISFGVALTCFSEFNFSVLALIYMILCTALTSGRNIMMKKMGQTLTSMEKTLVMAIVRTVFHLFEALYVGPKWDESTFGFVYLFFSGFSHLFQTFACCKLMEQLQSPVSHSVLNALKAVAVIFLSQPFFSHPMSFLNMIGVLVALLGAFLYSYIKVQLRAQAKVKGGLDQSCEIVPILEIDPKNQVV